MLIMPAILKEPDSATSSAATPVNASMTPFMTLDFKPVVSPTDWKLPACAIVPPAVIDVLHVYMASFIAFIALIAAMLTGWSVAGDVCGDSLSYT